MKRYGFSPIDAVAVYIDEAGLLWTKLDPYAKDRYDEPVVPYDGPVYATRANAREMRRPLFEHPFSPQHS